MHFLVQQTRQFWRRFSEGRNGKGGFEFERVPLTVWSSLKSHQQPRNFSNPQRHEVTKRVFVLSCLCGWFFLLYVLSSSLATTESLLRFTSRESCVADATPSVRHSIPRLWKAGLNSTNAMRLSKKALKKNALNKNALKQNKPTLWGQVNFAQDRGDEEVFFKHRDLPESKARLVTSSLTFHSPPTPIGPPATLQNWRSNRRTRYSASPFYSHSSSHT